MARRLLATASDPDTEASRLEHEVLQGHRNALHEEVAAIVENKQRLETEIKTFTQSIHQDLSAKQKEVENEKTKLTAANEALRAENKSLLKEHSSHISRNDLLAKEHEALTQAIANKKIEYDRLSATHASFSKAVEEANKIVAQLSGTIVDLEMKQAAIVRSIKEYENKRNIAASDHASTTKSLQTLSEEVASLNGNKSEIERAIAACKSELDQLQKTIVSSKAELVSLQAQRADHGSAMQKLTDEANQRLRNATLLEITINTKLEELKELESHFTTEHLARVGYRKVA